MTSVNLKTKKSLIKNKHFWIMIMFWMLVGASSRAFYDLQLLFEGMFESASLTNYIIAGAGIFAAVIGAPIVGFLVDKSKKYKKIIFIVIIFLIVALLLIPVFSKAFADNSYYMVLGIAAPLVGIGYSYRSVLDPFATAYTQTNSIPATITRGFYAVGAGIFSVIILTLIKNASNNKEYSYLNMYYIFIAYVGVLVLLIIFIGFWMKEPKHSSRSDKKRGNKIQDFKIIFKNKVFWIGLIALFFLIGMAESLDSVNKHTAFQNEVSWGNPSDVVMYVDLIRMLPECIFYIFTSLIFMRFGLKKSGILASIIFMICGAILSVATFFDIKWLFIIITAVTTPIIGSMCIGLGYEFMTSESPYSVRGVAGTIFNAVTYGLGGVLFFLVNGPLFDANLGYVLYAIYAGISFIPLIIFIFFIPNIQTKVKLRK